MSLLGRVFYAHGPTSVGRAPVFFFRVTGQKSLDGDAV